MKINSSTISPIYSQMLLWIPKRTPLQTLSCSFWPITTLNRTSFNRRRMFRRIFHLKKDAAKRLTSNLRYSDTFLIEFFILFPIFIVLPVYILNCPLMMNGLIFFFYLTGLTGWIGVTTGNIGWRYLFSQCLLISSTMVCALAFHFQDTHWDHLLPFMFQLLVALFLCWRNGLEKIDREIELKMEREFFDGAPNG